MIGSNGLTLDSQGRLIITAMTDRIVVRLAKRFNCPNDIVAKSDDAIYFTKHHMRRPQPRKEHSS